jgi:segregation and condensation protein B
MDPNEIANLALILESVLFAVDKPVSVQEFKRILPDCDSADILIALQALQKDYQEMNRSFVLKQVAGGYEFRTKAEYAPYVIKMLRTSPSRLSRAAMETLAIIAYKQPIIRHEIELLRGVDVGGILRTLLEKNLIKVVGRKNIPGKPIIYGTTSHFLEVFDLQDIKSLPELKEIKELESDENRQEAFSDENYTDRRENPPANREAGGEKDKCPTENERPGKVGTETAGTE